MAKEYPSDHDRCVEKVSDLFKDSAALKSRMIESGAPDVLVSMASRVVQSIEAGGKVMLCGNGGSAADAQHLAAELLSYKENQLHKAIKASALVEVETDDE